MFSIWSFVMLTNGEITRIVALPFISKSLARTNIWLWGFCRILWATPLIHLFHLEEILLQLLAPVLTWIHYERRRSSQPKLLPFWLFSQYFTNTSYCPNNQSEFCGRRNEPIGAFIAGVPFPLPPPPPPLDLFLPIFLLPHPLPFIRLLRRLPCCRHPVVLLDWQGGAVTQANTLGASRVFQRTHGKGLD